MSKTQIKSILRSFIIVPLIASSMSMSAFTASINSVLADQKEQLLATEQEQTPEEIALQQEREEKAAKIDAYFASNNMPLAGTGMKMVVAAEKYGLDWRLVAAMATMESSGGKHACKAYPENAWGWNSCHSGLGGSTDAAIDLISQHLSGNHPRTAQYYADKETIVGILQTYNPPKVRPDYASKVMGIMKKIEETKI